MTAFVNRKQTGSLGGLAFSAALIAILGLGAVALDMSHVSAVRSELQNASDAAALAGAQAFVQGEGENAEANALDVAENNSADGRPVSNESPETEVTVQATPALVPGEANIVRVDSSVTIHHMLASIFGRPTDTISVRSRAGAYHSVTRLP